jgi:hypothetical protein
MASCYFNKYIYCKLSGEYTIACNNCINQPAPIPSYENKNDRKLDKIIELLEKLVNK